MMIWLATKKVSGCNLLAYMTETGERFMRGILCEFGAVSIVQGYWEVDEIGEVVFEEYSFGTKSNGRFHPFNIAFEPYDLEIKVIGNIFEHPHLLEAKGNEHIPNQN